MTKMGIFGLLFSILYVISEITFNIGLIDTVNSKNTEINTFNYLESLGRFLSSLGLSIFLLNLFKVKKINHYLISLIIMIGCFYATQSYIFNRIVDNLSPEIKYQAYSLGVYRNLYINDKIDSPIFDKSIPYNKEYNEVLNSMIGLILYNHSMSEKATQETVNFFDLNIKFDTDFISNVYDKIFSAKANIQSENLWKSYVIENKRFNNYQGFFKKEYENRFVKTLGIKPNLTKDEFMVHLQKLQDESFNIKDLVIVPENKDINMKALYLRDIPSDLNKEEWINYVDNYVMSHLKTFKLTIENIDNMPHARDIISSVIIVPIAIILSLFSIILNLGFVLFKIHKIIGYLFIGTVSVLAVISLFTNNIYELPRYIHSIVKLETYYSSSLSNYKDYLHSKFINDEQPNELNIIRLEKPQIPDITSNFDKLNKDFENFNQETLEFEVNGNNQVRDDLKIDDDKLEQSGYYGEVNKVNPYIK